MKHTFQHLALKYLQRSIEAFIVLLAITFLVNEAFIGAAILSYILSFVFVGSNYIVLRKLKASAQDIFVTRFYLFLGIRFLLILVVLVVVLQTIKIHQIYFTVSFIISYIFHSVIEMILINKLLRTD